MFESFQLEDLFVTDLLHRCSVNICCESTGEKNKELRVFSIFAYIIATLNRNSMVHNWGPVYGNITASDRGPEFHNVAQEPWLVEKSQECKSGGNKFSLVYVKDSANIIWICLQWFSCGLEEQSLLLSMSQERRMNHEKQTCIPGQVYLVLKRCHSCQFICSFLERIRVVKEGMSTLYSTLFFFCPVNTFFFLMLFLYKQRMCFIWLKSSN